MLTLLAALALLGRELLTSFGVALVSFSMTLTFAIFLLQVAGTRGYGVGTHYRLRDFNWFALG